ncbi:diacylglycerol lipase-beta [Puntigrus tetrazona]|uniref:diacylglycerol lipase-beta n=1 Tax=Puntigrus tetrazona TaxID=1606681 RepID=UPI001C8A20F0|nr:diacylglycerol lipase-beta [Puntigrus tetrazona]
MPGMVVFGRRWRIASDDLVFPGAFELFIRAVWWVVTLVLYTNHKGRFDCQGGAYLHNYLVVLLVLLAVIILTLCAIVYISAQGTIMNPGPRRSMPALVYLRALLYFPEFLWACLGAVWVSDNSTGCKPEEVGAVIGAVVSSWIILLSMVVGVLVVFDPLGSQRPGVLPDAPLGVRDLESSESSQLFYTAHSVASRVWESRLRLLCCCLPQDDNHRAAFSSIAQLVSGFFKDTDLVPSDIAAGLALLHQEQDKMEQCRDPDEVLPRSPSSPIREDLEVELEKAAHFMQFAAAAYGWPLYVYSNPLTGLCKLSGDCCRSRQEEYDLVGGDNLGCHFTSILQSTGLQYRDFIHISFHNQIYEIPFYVALDHKREAVLVAVRGTLSLKDVLTDLSAECENVCLSVEGVSGTCYAHKGISQAAHYIYKRLVNDGILSQAFSIAPEYKLVIAGHSLGAGAASLLAVLLRSTHPTLECYAFSPPGGLMSKALAHYSKQFVVSVVLGKDLVPRLSIPNMEDLKRRLLKMVSNCSKPKYKILMHGCWYELFGGTPDDFPTELENRREEALSQPLLGEESLLVQRSNTYQSLSSDDSPSHPTHLPLYLPGRVLHITEDGPARRHCFSQVRYRAEWSSETSFRNVLISPRMIADHMPDVVLRALRSLTREQPFALCPSSTSNSHLNVI